MSRELAPALLLLVGVALVANPLWAFPHAGEQVYTYQADRIEYADDYIRADSDLARLDCYGAHDQEPGCLLWARIAQQGPVTINFSGMDRFNYGTQYVVVEDDPDHWTFYERVIEKSTGSVTLRLERATPTEILANVAIEYDDLSDSGKEAVRTGNVTVRSDSLRGEGQVVQDQGEYYTFSRVATPQPKWGAGQARFIQSVLALVGLALALSGQRRRHS